MSYGYQRVGRSNARQANIYMNIYMYVSRTATNGLSENGGVGQGGRVGEGIKNQRSDRDGALTRVCMPKCD